MGIADQLDRIERDFVSGEQLVEALARQENVSKTHAASWLIRNIEALNEVPMIEFNKERLDFRVVTRRWTIEVLREIVADRGEPVAWDEAGNGYFGGWLSTDLRTFFSKTDVPYPETSLKVAVSTKVPAVFEDRTDKSPEEAQQASSIAQFLASHSKDFSRLEDWLTSLDKDPRRTSMALRVAIEKIEGFVPLYYLDSPSEGYPQPLTIEDSAAIWSELLLDLADASLPDIFCGVEPKPNRWVFDLFVRDADCLAFMQRAGLPHNPIKGIAPGVVAKGQLDFDAAYTRTSNVAANTTVSPPQNVVSSKSPADRELSNRERDGLLRAIGALLNFISGELPGTRRHPDFLSEADLIRRLDEHFDGFEGLSASNLSRKFPAAKRLLRN